MQTNKEEKLRIQFLSVKFADNKNHIQGIISVILWFSVKGIIKTQRPQYRLFKQNSGNFYRT